MEEVKDYKPFSEEEYKKLIDILSNVTSHLPEAHAPFIWNAFNGIRNATEPQPCTCASSGAHWGRAIGELRLWLRARGENF
jgi:hypothetical protein